MHRYPHLLPGDKDLLFTVESADTPRIAVRSFETGERRALVDGARGRYIPTGHIVFLRASSLWGVSFDVEALEVTSSPVHLLEDVAEFTVSDDGILAYQPFTAAGSTTLVWVDRSGEENPLTNESRRYLQPRLSPDERRVAYVVTEIGGQQDIYILDVERETRTRLTVEGNVNRWPIWTPDGSRIAFTSVRDDSYLDLFWKPTDGSGPADTLLEKSEVLIPLSWSPDSRVLSFYELTGDTSKDLWVLPIDGEPQPFVVTPFSEVSPVFSPDGQWIAYVSTESGKQEVYVTPYPGPGPRILVSSGGGREPSWSSDGRELFYRNGTQMLAVEIQTQPEFRAGRPAVLFEDPYELDLLGPGNPNYDVTADGERFLMVKRAEDTDSSRIHVVLNWFGELKRLVPTDN